MGRSARTWMGLTACVAFFVLVAVPLWVSGCGTQAVPTASPAAGTVPGVGGNQRPSFRFVTPERSVTISVGTVFTISWIDSDPDNNALIDLYLDPDGNQDSGNELLILGGREEDPDAMGADTYDLDTSRVPPGSYVLRAVISDGVNPPVLVNAPGEFSIVPEGTAELNQPPTVQVIQPSASRSLANGDLLVIEWIDNDPDDEALVLVSLDKDEIPNNDDPEDAADQGVILLDQTLEEPDPDPADPAGPNANADRYLLTLNIQDVPVRADGSPYHVKVTVKDGTNPAVHAYAPGEVFVLQQAQPEFEQSGQFRLVDLGRVGTIISGAVFEGFNRGAWLGSSSRTINDFDADGADDFVLVARYGRPQGIGPLGQAFIIYGLPPVGEAEFPGIGVQPDRGERFGGRISVNQVASSVSGVVIQAPHDVHVLSGYGGFGLSEQNVETGGMNMGITDVAFMPDVTGDGRPEVVFGLPFVDGMLNARDDDSGDNSADRTFASQEMMDFDVQDSHISSSGSLLANCPAETLLIGPLFTDRAIIQFELTGRTFLDLMNYLDPNQADGTLTNATLTLRLEVPAATLQAEVFGYFVDPDAYAGPCSTLPSFTVPAAAVTIAATGNAFTDVTADITAIVEDSLDNARAFFYEGATRGLIVLGIRPATSGETAGFTSSEGSFLSGPRLSLTLNSASNFSTGCYGDEHVNNFSSQPAEDPDDENDFPGLQYGFQPERVGSAVMLYSTNRGINSPQDATRLENTSIDLEYVGQQSFPTLTYGALDPVLENGERIGGARFQAALFDWYDAFYARLDQQQGPLLGQYGHTVDCLPDINGDGFAEFVVSAPENEAEVAYLEALSDLLDRDPSHLRSRLTDGGVHVFMGSEFGSFGEDRAAGSGGRRGQTSNSVIPYLLTGSATCGTADNDEREMIIPELESQIWLWDPEDPPTDNNEGVGYARFAGDYNGDGIFDLAMGAPKALVNGEEEAGMAFVVFNTLDVGGPGDQGIILGDIISGERPGLCVYGEHEGDHIGMLQGVQQNFDNSGKDDLIIASGDYDWNGVSDTGAVAVLFGGVGSGSGAVAFSDIGSIDAPGLVFYGGEGYRAGGGMQDGHHGACGSGYYGANGVVSGADFNGDLAGDLLIVAPGAVGASGNVRRGVVYLIYGRPGIYDPTQQQNNWYRLTDVGTSTLPGMIFVSPYEKDSVDAAAPTSVSFLGDINSDGFDDIMIGNPLADWVGLNPANRRADAGEAYLIYGNNARCNNPANWYTDTCFGAP
ncbi:MAG: FG-GAP repeat protein [Phycisphaerales bacterium]|nr:MAG: FG-GAP repeat protein [Phycisphaerales bacterium]